MNTVKLSDTHLKVIIKALETYYRLRSGQVGIALDTAYNHSMTWDSTQLIQQMVRQNVDYLKGLSSNSAFSFNSEQIGDARIAYEIQGTLQEFLAVKNNNGYYGWTTNFHTPLKASDEPLPVVKEHKNYKDFPLTRQQSNQIIGLIDNKEYNKVWDWIHVYIVDLPKGEKYEIVFDTFKGEEAVYGGSNKRVVVRVTKPYKENN